MKETVGTEFKRGRGREDARGKGKKKDYFSRKKRVVAKEGPSKAIPGREGGGKGGREHFLL